MSHTTQPDSRSGAAAPSTPDFATPEPFATCVAALCRHISQPERALMVALHQLAVQRKGNAEDILASEAKRHGYPSSDAFRQALLPAIALRRHEIDASKLFTRK